MEEESILKIEQLSIDAVTALSRKRIVESLDLEVKRGEIYGVVGETGSGKSISMMASVGLASRGLHVTEGSITFRGKTVHASEQGLLRRNLAAGVSLLFQNAKGALNPFLPIERQLERVLKLRRISGKECDRKVRDLLSAVGLDPEEIRRKYAHEVSGGQAQRVAMACSLATDPQLLIADEPTTALDVTTERDVLEFLKEMCRDRSMAMVLIAHNLSLVAENCSRISILHAGHVIESGSVEEVFRDPLHPYTQGLLTAIPDVDDPHELVPLQGSVWGGTSLNGRCRFSHRCEFMQERCNQSVPPMIHFGSHSVRCLRYQGEP